jgi:hypothetical protein
MIEMTNETWHPTEAVLNEYLDGELSPTEKERMELHMKKCASCRERLQELGRVFDLLENLGEKEFEVDLTARVINQLQPRSRWTGWVLALEGLLTILLIVIARPWESGFVRLVSGLLMRGTALLPRLDLSVLLFSFEAFIRKFENGVVPGLHFPALPLQVWIILMVCAFAVWLAGNRLLLSRNGNK